MAGKLEFALGLAAGNFVSGLGKASGAVKSFLGGMVGLGAIAHGVWGQVEKGAALNDLSKQTGESVGNLYRLQKGMAAVGLDADGLGGMLFRLNSALGGISETGEPTGKVFEQVGLSIEGLKKLNGPEALQAIAQKLSQLDRQSATAAAGKIFGRGGAAQFLQLARSSKEFADGLRGAARQAAMMQRSAETFDSLEKGVGKIKNKLADIWLPIADAVAPMLERVVTKLGNIDLFSFGKRIGEELQIAFNAVDLGQFEAYFTLSMKSGVFDAMKLLATMAEKLDLTGKNKEKDKGPGFGSKLWAGTKGVVAGGLGLWNEMGAMVGVPGAREMSDKRFDQAYGLFNTAGINDGILMRVADAAQKGIEGGENPFAKELAALRASLLASTTRTSIAEAEGKDSLNATKGQKVPAMDGSKLEKMGFVFGGASSGDHARATAQNTGKMVTLLQALVDKADPVLDASPMNQRV